MTIDVQNSPVSENSDLGDLARHIAELRADLANLSLGLTRDVAERGKRAARSFGHNVEHNPILYIALAVVAGIVGGKLLSR